MTKPAPSAAATKAAPTSRPPDPTVQLTLARSNTLRGRFAGALGAHRRDAFGPDAAGELVPRRRDASGIDADAKPPATFDRHLGVDDPLGSSHVHRGRSPSTRTAPCLAHDEHGHRQPRSERASSSRDRSDDGGAHPELAPFRPSPILLAPAPAVSQSPAAERPDVAAIVERIVVAMRVGTAGREHRASFTLGGRALEDVGVELSVVDGCVRGVLRAPAHRMDAARRVAAAACETLRARGFDLDELAVERLG